MSRRVLLTSAVIALLLGAVFLAPGFPPVRTALLEWALRFAADAGVQVSFERAEGNAWRRVELHGVKLAGFGAEAQVDRLELAYHLPSLLGGELPLSVAASGVTGGADLRDLGERSGREASEEPVAGLPIRVVLREVDLQDVVFASANAPFTIPDATVSDVTVVPEPGALVLGARVTTEHGSVVAEGRLTLPGYNLTGTITQGDVAVAQHWWPGATGGTVSGPFSLRRGQLNADLRLVDGQIDQSGFTVSKLAGNIAMRYPIITTALAGEGLGGPVTAEGTVNIAALSYTATGTATPQLAEAAGWLKDLLGLEPDAFEASGRASVTASVDGWTTPAVRGTASARGHFAGLPLDQLSASLNLQVGGATRGTLDALLAGGTVTASIAPSTLGSRLEFTGTSLDLNSLEAFQFSPGGVVEEVRGQVELAGTPAGTVTARWGGRLADYVTSLNVDGRLDADGLQAFFVAAGTPATSVDGAGTVNATGAVVLAGERLEAGVSVADLQVPGLDRPLRLGLTAQGRFDDLLLSATVENERPVLLDVAWLQPGGALAASDPVDVRGGATGRLTGGAIQDVAGTFGPVTVFGAVDLAPLSARLDLSVAPLTVRVGGANHSSSAPVSDPAMAAGERLGTTEFATPPVGGEPVRSLASPDAAAAPVRATLSSTAGTLSYASGALEVRASSTVSEAVASSVTFGLEGIDWRFTWRAAGEEPGAGLGTDAADGDTRALPVVTTWRFDATAQAEQAHFRIDASGDPYLLTLNELPVSVGGSGRPALVSGRLVPAPGGALHTVVSLTPNSGVAGLRLVNGATFTGAMEGSRLNLTGAVGNLPVTGVVSWAQPEVMVEAVVVTADDPPQGAGTLNVSYTPATTAWSLAGAAPLGPVLTELGVSTPSIDYVGQLAYTTQAGYVGAAQMRLTDPLPLSLRLLGQGQELNLDLQGELGGVPLAGGGVIAEPLVPALVRAFGSSTVGSPNLVVDVGPLQGLTVDAAGVRGAGEVAAQALGPVTIGPAPWELEFAWSSATGHLATGGEVLRVSLQDGAIHAAGSLAAPLTYGGASYRVTAWPGASPGQLTSGRSAADFIVGGSLASADGGADLASVAGTLERLSFELHATLEELAAALPADFQPRGHLTATGSVNVLTGPTYEGQLTLTPAADTVVLGSPLPAAATSALQATFSGVGGAFDLTLDGEGLQVERTPDAGAGRGTLTLVANGADFSRFLPAGAEGVLDGALSYGVTGWRGQLEARLTAHTMASGAAADAANTPLLDATATFTGAFSTLDITTSGRAAGGTTFAASGPLLPAPNVAGRFQVGPDLLEGNFAWNEGVRATLLSKERTLGNALHLPELRAELTVDADTGLVALRSLTDERQTTEQAPTPSLDLELRGGNLTGGLRLPVLLNGTPFEVNAAAGGTLSDPRIDAQVLSAGATSAPLAQATGSLSEGALLTVQVPTRLLQELMPSAAASALGLLGSEVTADATLLPSGAWRAALNTEVVPNITSGTGFLELSATASGTLSSAQEYAGEVRLLAATTGEPGVATQVAVVPFAGTGADANARLDLAGVSWQALGEAIGTELNVGGTGELTLASQPLAASLTVDLVGDFGGNSVAIRGTAPADLYLSLEGPAGELEGTLAWAGDLTDGGTALLTGHLAGRPVELILNINEGLTTGDLSARAVGAELTAHLTTEPQADPAGGPTVRQISVVAQVPPGSWAQFGGYGEAGITVTGAAVRLEHLTASIDGLLGHPDDPANRLTVLASGPLTRDLRVKGLVTSPRLQESLVLNVWSPGARPAQGSEAEAAGGGGEGVTAQVSWRNLALTASMQDGGSLNLSGSAATTDVVSLLRAAGGALSPTLQTDIANLAPKLPHANLTWTVGSGWQGDLHAVAALPWVPALGAIELRALGEAGTLRVQAEAEADEGLARLQVVVPARSWLTAALTGSIELDLPSAVLLPGLTVPLQLRSAALVEGTVAAPTVSGSLLVSGAVTAQGSYGFAGGVGHLNATGPHMTVAGRLDADGAFAEARITELPLDPWVPQLPSSSLTLSARFSGEQISVERIEVKAPNSVVRGRATVGIGGNGTPSARFSAALETNVNLADLELGDLSLTGTVRGPLVISSTAPENLLASNIVANLAALHVGTAGLDWSVSGNLTLGGTLADPLLATQLSGDGTLRGLLTVSARPAAREYAITSSLSSSQATTDVRVDLSSGAARAAGSVRVGNGLLLLSHAPTATPDAGAEATDLVVTGAGRFAGLSARLQGDLSALSLAADLGSLTGSLAGDLQLTADATAGSWLQGQVTDASVGSFALAPISISAVTLGSPVVVQSSDLRATLNPTSLDWTVSIDHLRLGEGEGAPQVTAWGRGRGLVGSLDASLEAPELELALEIRQDGNTTLLLEGEAYGGELLVNGNRTAGSGEWGGSGRFAGGHLAGFEVSAQVSLLGVGLLPTAVLNTRADNGLTVTGNASLGPSGLSLDQFVAGAPLEQTVRLQGSLLPRTELTLSTIGLPPGVAVSAAGAARATTSSVRLTSISGLSPSMPSSLRANGAFTLPVGPARVELSGAGSPPLLEVSLAALPRWRAEAQLVATDLLDLVQQVAQRGLKLAGADDAKGELHLDTAGMNLRLSGFGLEFAGVNAEATGTVGLTEANLRGYVRVSTDLPVAERETGYVFPWELTAVNGVWQLESGGAHGHLSAAYGVREGAGTLSLSADLSLSGGGIEAQLGLQPGGLSGVFSVSSVRLLSPELGPLTIDAAGTVADGRVGGSANLGSPAGSLLVNGSWGLGELLPAAVVPDAPTGGRLEARVRALELSAIPLLAAQVPELYGQVNGTAQLRDGFLLGQLVAQEVGVADITTPMQLAFSGRPTDLNLDLQLRGALGRANLAGGVLSGMFRFERFPLNLLSTAVVGPADFSADLTGVMRFDGPLSAPQDGYLRLATEEVRLERMGVTTLGNVTITFDQQALMVERAEFAGLGNWRASGELRSNNFDFRLEADQADFTPLLGLVPQFARLGVGALGSFDLSVLGSAANPSIELVSPDLQVEVSGTTYRLQETHLNLDGVALAVSSRVLGLTPISGDLQVAGDALLSLFPFNLSGTRLDIAGQADLSTFGRMTNVVGTLEQLPDGTPAVQLEGLMGEKPLTIEGTLAPLALTASGAGVTMRLPGLLVDRAVVDANITLVAEPGGVALGGTVVAEEVILDPAARRPPAEQEPTATESTSGGELAGVEPPGAGSAQQAGPPAARGGGMAALRFDELGIRAPGRVTLTTNVGAFEAGLDLVLSGTGAEPRLAGTATAIRGNLRFGGRDFTIDRAVATFTPNRGVYPELDVAAHTEFEKQRVVSAAPNVSFAAPREGGTFEVRLAFFGPVEPTSDGGFRFDIQPILGSNALIEVEGEGGVGSAARPFTEAELMALVTLGRFELNAGFIGAGGLGEVVATGALDTAIDLLVVSGLEAALREALGFDVVEIRTSSLASLLEDGGQPFGVSLRVGGYLHPELFASYRIGTYDGADPEYALTNEVLLRYGLGPLDLDVIGRIDLPAAGSANQPRPEIGALLSYQFSPWLGVEGGVTVSPTRSRIEFGVTIRW